MDLFRPMIGSELAQRLSVIPVGEVLVGRHIDVLADKPRRSIHQQDVDAPLVLTVQGSVMEPTNDVPGVAV